MSRNSSAPSSCPSTSPCPPSTQFGSEHDESADAKTQTNKEVSLFQISFLTPSNIPQRRREQLRLAQRKHRGRVQHSLAALSSQNAELQQRVHILEQRRAAAANLAANANTQLAASQQLVEVLMRAMAPVDDGEGARMAALAAAEMRRPRDEFNPAVQYEQEEFGVNNNWGSSMYDFQIDTDWSQTAI